MDDAGRSERGRADLDAATGLASIAGVHDAFGGEMQRRCQAGAERPSASKPHEPRRWVVEPTRAWLSKGRAILARRRCRRSRYHALVHASNWRPSPASRVGPAGPGARAGGRRRRLPTAAAPHADPPADRGSDRHPDPGGLSGARRLAPRVAGRLARPERDPLVDDSPTLA